MPPPSLSFDRVSKWYGPLLALNQVTLTLRAGITGLVGANGSGKSSLIKLATGLISPSIGSVAVQGQNADHWRSRRLVGYCPDHDAFYETMTGREFVRTMAELFGFAKSDARDRTEAVLLQVGMSDRADRIMRGYSKGMRQRIKLAQALLHDPGLLILDEPLSGIDPVGRGELLAVFRDLAAAGKQLLISSHELEELEKLADSIILLARGRVAAVGTLEEIRTRLDDRPQRIRIRAHGPRELARELLQLPEVLGVEFGDGDQITVLVKQTRQFLNRFGELAAREEFRVLSLEPLDDSAHALLGYLLGGSGKT